METKIESDRPIKCKFIESIKDKPERDLIQEIMEKKKNGKDKKLGID
jgi:hypothetical protein